MKFKLGRESQLPTRGSDGAAGYDLYAVDSVTIKPGETKVVPTEIKCAMPKPYVGLIMGRSSVSKKVDVRAGVMDQDYRGNWGVMLHNSQQYTLGELIWNAYFGEITSKDWSCVSGDRVAQAVFVQCYMGPAQAVEDLDETVRGTGGFGSTGK